MFHLYGLLIGVGVLLGVWVARKQAVRWGIKPELIDDALVWIVVPAIIGARLYHVATDWQLYTQASVVDLFSIWRGGLGLFGALSGGIIGIIIFIQIRKGLMNQTPTQTFFIILE